jgi:cell division protein FtsB
LELQVNDHKQHAEGLAERLGMIENENKQLRQEVDTLKRQNLLLQQQQILQPQAC